MNILEIPLEDFTQDMIEEAIDRESKLMMRIEGFDVEIEALQDRLLTNKGKHDEINGLKREIGLLRQDRADLAGKGQDLAVVSELIADKQQNLQESEAQLEILEDEKTGIMNAVEELRTKRHGTVGSLAHEQDKTRIIKYCVAANEYNQHAEAMAKTVEVLWEHKASLPSPYDTQAGGPLPHPLHVWCDTALWRIPVLRKDWQPGSNQPEFFFSRPK